MKLKHDFITHTANGETVLVPVGGSEFSGIVRGNATLGAILDCLQQECDEADIVAELQKRYDAPAEAIARDVKKALSELRNIGALDE